MFVLGTIFLSSSGFIDKNDNGLSLKTLFRYRKIPPNPQNSLLAEMTFSSSKQSLPATPFGGRRSSIACPRIACPRKSQAGVGGCFLASRSAAKTLEAQRRFRNAVIRNPVNRVVIWGPDPIRYTHYAIRNHPRHLFAPLIFTLN